MSMFLQQVINGMSIGCVYALVALGYTMVYGVLRVVNFAHGELVMLGPMFALSLLRATGVITGRLNIIPVPLTGLRLVIVLMICFLGGALFCAVLGLIMERVAYRPLRHASAEMVLISSLGVSIILENATMLIFGRNVKGFPRMVSTRYFTIMGATFSSIQVLNAIVSGLLVVALVYLVNRTYLGRCIRSVAEDSDAAGLMGIEVNRIIASVFVLGPAIGAASGVLFSMTYEEVYYFMGSLIGMKGWTAAILGGIGNITGAAIGGLMLGVLETIGAGYLPIITGGLLGSEYRHIFSFLVLIAMLIYRPQGILGEAIETR